MASKEVVDEFYHNGSMADRKGTKWMVPEQQMSAQIRDHIELSEVETDTVLVAKVGGRPGNWIKLYLLQIFASCNSKTEWYLVFPNSFSSI